MRVILLKISSGLKIDFFKATVLLFFVCWQSNQLLAKPLEVAAIWFPPFYNIEKEGDKVTGISGINVDIVTKVLDEIGESYVLKYYPAKRVYANMIKGKTHIFYGIKVPASHVSPDYILHSQNKISKITLRAYHLDSTPTITKKEDLIGKSVIVFRGYGYGGFIEYIKHPKNKIIIQTADSQVNGFKMLKKKRADYLVAFERPARATMKTFPKGFTKDITFGEPLFVADGYFVLSRKTPKAEELLQRMEEAYLKLNARGAFEGMIIH